MSSGEHLREAIEYVISLGYSRIEAEAFVREQGAEKILRQKQGLQHVLPSAADLDEVARETDVATRTN